MGTLYCAAARWTVGYAAEQAGHSRSSNSTMATLAPAGGLSIEVSLKAFGCVVPENCARAGSATVASIKTATDPKTAPTTVRRLISCLIPLHRSRGFLPHDVPIFFHRWVSVHILRRNSRGLVACMSM